METIPCASSVRVHEYSQMEAPPCLPKHPGANQNTRATRLPVGGSLQPWQNFHAAAHRWQHGGDDGDRRRLSGKEQARLDARPGTARRLKNA